MKSLKRIIIVVIVFVVGIGACLSVAALSTADKLRAKVKRVQAAGTVLGRKQIPIDGFNLVLVEVKKAIDKGDAVAAEKLLDAVLARKDVVANMAEIVREPASTNRFDPPVQEANESFTDAFSVAQLVEVAGYDDHMMEPCITLDGKYLLFNNSNDGKADTHIHICKRLDNKNKFQYIGKLPGTISGSKDMAPSVDHDGNLYFTSLRTYDTDLKSLYVGKMVNNAVANVVPVAGDISPTVQTWINMDCCISADGKQMVVSRARFKAGDTVPAESDLQLFVKQNESFSAHPQSAEILKNVNTRALEYAPSLSADQLELFFTRAQKLPEGQTLLRIMQSKRANVSEPFGPPVALRTAFGFVEAPTLPALNHELFFHKLEGDKFKIFRCDRIRRQ